jgi:hypothetical protein
MNSKKINFSKFLLPTAVLLMIMGAGSVYLSISSTFGTSNPVFDSTNFMLLSLFLSILGIILFVMSLVNLYIVRRLNSYPTAEKIGTLSTTTIIIFFVVGLLLIPILMYLLINLYGLVSFLLDLTL